MEETVSALRKEVAEAWDSYKVAQERAAIREEEYQDEIQQIQRAKATDKAQLQAQLTKQVDEVSEAIKMIRAAQRLIYTQQIVVIVVVNDVVNAAVDVVVNAAVDVVVIITVPLLPFVCEFLKLLICRVFLMKC